jgi:hypothetical protein
MDERIGGILLKPFAITLQSIRAGVLPERVSNADEEPGNLERHHRSPPDRHFMPLKIFDVHSLPEPRIE